MLPSSAVYPGWFFKVSGIYVKVSVIKVKYQLRSHTRYRTHYCVSHRSPYPFHTLSWLEGSWFGFDDIFSEWPRQVIPRALTGPPGPGAHAAFNTPATLRAVRRDIPVAFGEEGDGA